MIKDGWELKNFGSDSRLIKEKNIETFIFIEILCFIDRFLLKILFL